MYTQRKRMREKKNVFQHSATAVPKKTNLKRRKLYFGSQFCRFQSMFS